VRSSALVAGAGLWVIVHTPGAGCWWRGGACLHLPQAWGAWGVRVYLLAKSKLDLLVSRKSRAQTGLSDRQGFVLVYPGRLANREWL